MIVLLLKAALGFLLGTFPAAYLCAQVRGVDIREHGSGNVGATNALRVLGKREGLIVLLVDMGKGFAAVTLIAGIGADAGGAISPQWQQAVCGIAAVLGHVFNPFLGFRGGKGVATGAGVIAGTVPLALGFGLAVFLIVFGITRYVSVGSLMVSVLIPFFLLMIGTDYSFLLMSAVLCVIIVVMHRKNIQGLLNGREGKLKRKS